jgi:hypothetical protein
MRQRQIGMTVELTDQLAYPVAAMTDPADALNQRESATQDVCPRSGGPAGSRDRDEEAQAQILRQHELR